MRNTTVKEKEILFSRKGELVRITPVLNNAIRVQAFPDCSVIDENYNLMPQDADCIIEETDRYVTMTTGNLMLKMYHDGKIFFFSGDKKLLEEQPELTFGDGIRHHLNIASGVWKSRVTFESNDDEHFYGLGHQWDNRFDLKGSSFDIINTNAKCTIPFVYSSLGYGFLWNVPSTGSVELSCNRTRWSTDACRFVDYVVIGGQPKQVLSALADLTGHCPEIPHWATGFWQSRLRYETQEDLLNVARRYKKEGIPLSVIIADYFHWTEQGDYRFDTKYWQDVKAMTDELHQMGTRLVVSIWPTVNENSENYRYMSENNMLIRTSRGSDRVFPFYGWQAEIDATNPQTRKYVWSKIKENYLDNGVDGVWFDEAEPEIHPEHFDNLIFHKGRGDKVQRLHYSKV